MILSFADEATETLFRSGKRQKVGWQSVAARKLDDLNAATRLDDLASPPGTRLENLYGDREGQHRIRINDQWRVCFVWTEAGPVDVEIVDDH